MTLVTSSIRAERPWALKTLPPFPQVAIRLLDLLSREDAAMKEIVELVRLDAAFGAELLRLANSAAFGFRHQIDSLSHAITLIGTERVRALAMTVAVGAYGRKAFSIAALKQCWHHSLATAFLTEELATACSINRERAYTAGLLRDIGCLGLLVGYPAEYSSLIAVANENALDILDVERAMFDIDHREAGRWLAEDWKFPEELRDIIATPDDEPIEPPLRLSSIVRLASHLADTVGFQAVQPPNPWTFQDVQGKLPGAAADSLENPERISERLRIKVTAIAR
jgi:HD-like signal output (HDOD) protein